MGTVPIREIATYGVTYPKENLTFAYKSKKLDFEDILTKKKKTDEKFTVESKRVRLEIQTTTIRDIVFDQCNFHSKGGAEIDVIKLLTFDGIDFRQCLMGTNRYFRVYFKDCTFFKCDFRDAEFEDCIFTRCTFEQCSAYHCRFTSTEINPDSFLKSIKFPQGNYKGVSKSEKEFKEREWVETQLFISNQIFNSNLSLSNSEYADKALYELKKKQLQVKLNNLKYPDYKQGASKRTIVGAFFSRDCYNVVRTWFTRINLMLTDGGTSLFKLFGFLLMACSITTIILGNGNFEYAGDSLTIDYLDSKPMDIFTKYVSNFFHALALFLTFGYTSFKSNVASQQTLLIIISILGLFWYALLIPVVVRKIYV